MLHIHNDIILQSETMKGLPGDGVIGNGMLSRFNVVFDYQRERLYLEPNASFHEPFE